MAAKAALLIAALLAAPLLAADAAATTELFQWRPFLAPFHAVVLHFPIGFFAAAFILELRQALRPKENLRGAVSLMLWLTLVSGLAAASLGLLRADGGSYDPAMLEHHRNYGLLVLIFTVGAIALNRGSRNNSPAWSKLYRASLVCTFGLLVMAGHKGGNLTHGSRYLVENAPPFVRRLLEQPAARVSATESNGVFAQKIKPVLDEKCGACHNAERKKGGYRVDDKALAFTPGKSGKAPIKAGDPLGSHLVELILLPADHDDVMPPAGKKALTPEEIGLIIEWIRQESEGRAPALDG